MWQRKSDSCKFCRHCGYKFSEASKQGNVLQPIIKDLVVMTDTYTIGSFVDIMWDVTNATHISLNGMNVTNHDSYEYEVKGDEDLMLIASNDYMRAKRSLNCHQYLCLKLSNSFLRIERSKLETKLSYT